MNDRVVHEKTMDERFGSFIEMKKIVFWKRMNLESFEQTWKKLSFLFTEQTNFQKVLFQNKWWFGTNFKKIVSFTAKRNFSELETLEKTTVFYRTSDFTIKRWTMNVAARKNFWSCRLRNCIFGKLTLGKNHLEK